MERKSIRDFQEAFKDLFREAENTLGCGIKQIRISRYEEPSSYDAWGDRIYKTKYECNIDIE